MDKTRIGKILNAHGVRGELKVEPLTDDPARYTVLEQVYIEDRKKHYTLYDVESVRFHKEQVLVKLKGIDDMDAAKAVKHLHLAINKSDRMPLEEGAYYIDDLIGLEVYEDERKLGVLKEVLQPGANDVYVVDSPIYPELLIPALKTVIVNVDLAAGRMDVKLPKGLVD
ncbi:MAG: ribosome maturation factor RimM [Peptococcaceae bacterium]|nr:ribosome maturation factor RimM [Peptococcaceae bacterium]